MVVNNLNTGIKKTLGVNLGTGTNLWTATTDAQGNSVQL